MTNTAEHPADSDSQQDVSPPPYRLSPNAVLEAWDVGLENGLSEGEVEARLSRYGPNLLSRRAPRGAVSIFVSQFKSLVVGLLVAATALAFAVGDTTEGVAILVVILFNTIIGFATELRAMRSMEALLSLGTMHTRVRRDGETQVIDGVNLVPGDIVLIEGGDVMTADIRLLTASRLQSDESALTGESTPVSKQVDSLAEDVSLSDRTNMLYKGTFVACGTGEGVVVGTGMATELGEITKLVSEGEDELTPLERQLNRLGHRLVWVIVFITATVTGLGVLRGNDLWLMVETGIALAVASIPEGLPIVATLALSRGMLRMARRKALVRRLHSVETLGSTSVICTDKTGTLTENKMVLTRILCGSSDIHKSADGDWRSDREVAGAKYDSSLQRMLTAAVLCNNARLDDDGDTGDPMEIALLRGAESFGIDFDAERTANPKLQEEAFESDTKMMATYHSTNGQIFIAVKGAPEAVLERTTCLLSEEGERELSDTDRESLASQIDTVASEGFRVLAIAFRKAQSAREHPYENLVWAGLVGLIDPPRHDIQPAIEECARAGIRVVMVTGDQAQTALYVAREVGIAGDDSLVENGDRLNDAIKLESAEKQRLLDTTIFSRVSPKQKLQLIALHQQAGNIVAMTGDGVNDAPALKKADIGVAMGMRGTQVAREVADVVLKDDSFETIVYAVREGRVIYGNIRKFVLYLLSCNVAEILVIFLAALVSSKLPILPLQILFLNLVTDIFPAFALGVGEGRRGIMERPPRPAQEPVLTRRHWVEIGVYGLFISGATLLVFFLAHNVFNWTDKECVTASFLTLSMAQLWHVIDMRESGAPFTNNQVTRNRFVWGAIGLCMILLVVAVYFAPLAGVLGTSPISAGAWGLVAGCSIVPVVLDSIFRTFYPLAPR